MTLKHARMLTSDRMKMLFKNEITISDLLTIFELVCRVLIFVFLPYKLVKKLDFRYDRFKEEVIQTLRNHRGEQRHQLETIV